MSVITRSNRRGDWRKFLSIPPSTKVTEEETQEDLSALHSLPVIPKILPKKNLTNQRIETPTSNAHDLLDTSMYAETPTPAGFGMELLPHQKRGLSWMLSVEDDKCPILVKQANQKIRIFGGILADKPGTGKSVLTIALMKLNPCLGYFKDDRSRIRSKATLILCPRNIVDQWKQEIKRCDNSLKIVEITTSRMLNTIPSLDIALADVILLPYYLLADQFYISMCRQVEKLDPPALTTFEDLTRCKGILTRFHFHRIVYDEVHEIYNQTRKDTFDFVPFMETFHANWRWGITGTPPQKQKLFYDVLNCISRTNIDEYPNFLQIKQKIVRSNNPDLRVPPLTQKIKWIDLTARELALYNLFRDRGVHLQLMACSHFNVNNIPINQALNMPKTMTLDEVADKLAVGHADRITKMEQDELPNARRLVQALLLKLGSQLATYSKLQLGHTTKSIYDDLQARINRTRAKLRHFRTVVAQCERDIPKLKAELQYFMNILTSLGEDGEESCPICLDEFAVGQDLIGLTTCGHAFCRTCILTIGNAPCPNCRQAINQANVMFITSSNPDAQRNILCDIFGSKIHETVMYIVAQLSLDPSFKFIIFVQYSKLATIVTKACLQYELKAVNLCGSVTGRKGALKKFEHQDYQVLLMSSDQSVAGVNILAASHVLILHPFNLGSDEESVAAEKQGIARAHRLGQTRPVTVVRFATRGTIEEKMTRERIGNNWIQE